jgi:tetratricopeptide (TPR) repeat protein
MLTIAERMDDPTWTAQLLSRLGRIAFYEGDWTQARQDLEDAFHRFPQRAFGGIGQFIPFSLGLLRQAEGKHEEAKQLFDLILQAWTSTGPLVFYMTQAVVAEKEILAGCLESARARVEPLLGQVDAQVLVSTQLRPMFAWVQVELGALERAEALLQQNISEAQAQQMRGALECSLRVQALLRLRQARWPEAQAALEEALALCRAMPNPYSEAKVLYIYGLLHRAKGEPELARERFQAALAILNRLGEHHYAAYVERALTPLSPT